MSANGVSFHPDVKDSALLPPTTHSAHYDEASGSTIPPSNNIGHVDLKGTFYHHDSYDGAPKHERWDTSDSQQDLLSSARQSRILYDAKGPTVSRFENLGARMNAAL
jgi:hypothetical protein